MKRTEFIEALRRGASKSPDVGSHMRKYQELCDLAANYIYLDQLVFADIVNRADTGGRRLLTAMDTCETIQQLANEAMERKVQQ